MSDAEGTIYRTDAINPSGVEWAVTVKPLPFGYVITLTNVKTMHPVEPTTQVADRTQQ
jgi:hypothetical protein